MIITKLEICHTKKTRVYIDEQFAFVVYPQDIRKYSLKENMELPETIYRQIMEETIIRRAKQKAMALLQKSDRTEKELSFKLKQAEYPQIAIDYAIEYVKNYNYIIKFTVNGRGVYYV